VASGSHEESGKAEILAENKKKGRWKRRLLWFMGIASVLAVAFALWYRVPPKTRFPGYAHDVAHAPAPGTEAEAGASLRAGFASRDITPKVGDDEDTVWLAGFRFGRSATGVHDRLWARALVIDDGERRVGICVLDLLGHHYEDTIEVRKALPEELGFDYVALVSTHNHEGPDSVGMWGAVPVVTGRSETYMKTVREAAVAALTEAANGLAPARLTVAEASSGTEAKKYEKAGRDIVVQGLIRDDRPPFVIDPTVTALRFDAEGAEEALGTVVIWSNHPEAVGKHNRLITSDFPHYLRQRMEAEAGGTCLFLPGSIGGLMSPLEVEVTLPDGTKTEEASYEQAEVIGEHVARVALGALESEGALKPERAPIAVRSRTLRWPVENKIFYLAAKLGVIPRGMDDYKIMSEVGVLSVGPLELLMVPGELYPELYVGGIENPPGADYPGTPPEGPALRSLMRGEIRAVVGLSNDLVGYIIPKGEWDNSGENLYGHHESFYGEINSTGPDAAAAIHRGLSELLEANGVN
jgi:hypothetical protein